MLIMVGVLKGDITTPFTDEAEQVILTGGEAPLPPQGETGGGATPEGICFEVHQRRIVR